MIQRRDFLTGAAAVAAGAISLPPLAWAQGLASQLGVGHLVVGPGAQHTGYPQGDDCLDPIIDAYLLSRRVPADGAACG